MVEHNEAHPPFNWESQGQEEKREEDREGTEGGGFFESPPADRLIRQKARRTRSLQL